MLPEKAHDTKPVPWLPAAWPREKAAESLENEIMRYLAQPQSHALALARDYFEWMMRPPFTVITQWFQAK